MDEVSWPDTEAINLYDTRSRRIRRFEPRDPGQVRMYTCGPTVYAPQHLGNMRSQVAADVLRRALLAQGLTVQYVTNITDVGHLTSDADNGEDKIETAAAQQGATVQAITERWTTQWRTDRRRLGCLEPDLTPRASEHIDEQIAMVKVLEGQGRTYRIADGVYFDTATFPRYAEFAGLALNDLESTGRVDHVADKRHPADFALWKFSAGAQRLQEWDSPWGTGFPGWHLECSAMATRYLGDHLDIHTGGVDHIRVHHTNEIAQSECALGVHPWVSFWVHNEFLNMSGEKLSKSKGHVWTLDRLVERGIGESAFRFFLLQAHYRQQQTFSVEAVGAAGVAFRRLIRQAVPAREAADGDLVPTTYGRAGELHDAFWGAIADDLNTPRALSVVAAVAREAELGPAQRWSLLADFDRVLGLDMDHAVSAECASDVTGDPVVAARLEQRQAARAARDFDTADAIRSDLLDDGIEVVDTVDGTRAHRWFKLSSGR